MTERPKVANRRPCLTLEQLYFHERANALSVIGAIKGHAQLENKPLSREEAEEIADRELKLVDLYKELEAAGLNQKVWKYYNLNDSDPCKQV